MSDASRDSTISRSSSWIVGRELLEPGDDARRTRRGPGPAAGHAAYWSASSSEEHAAETAADAVASRAEPPQRPGERRGRREEQRAGKDHRQEPPRHPEVLRDDADLVEEEQREDGDRDEERRIAPEALAREQRVAEQRRQERREREVEVRERPQRVGVVVGQLAARLAEEERVDRRCADHERASSDRGAAPDHGRQRRDCARRRPAPPSASASASRERGVLPPRQVAREDDRQVGVRAHRAEQVRPASEHGRGERTPRERPAHAAARRPPPSASAGQHAGDAEHGVEAQEQQQAEQQAGDRREERDRRRRARARSRAAPRRAAPASRLRRSDSARTRPAIDVAASAGRRGRRPPARPTSRAPAKYTASTPRIAHTPTVRRAPGQAVEAVADRNRCGKEVRKLADDRARVRVLDEEPHERGRCSSRSRCSRRKEQVAREVRHRRRRPDRGRRARRAARSGSPSLMYDAGILAADDVFRRREEPPQRQAATSASGTQRCRAGPARRGAEPQAEARDAPRPRARSADVGDEQPLEAVAVRARRARARPTSDTATLMHDCPEQPLLGIERRAPVAVEQRQAEDHGARQPAR